MIGKPTPAVTEVYGVESALEALANRLGSLHEQISYLQEHAALVSLPPSPCYAEDETPPVNQPVKSPVRAKIEGIITSVEIATSRVMRVRCNLDL